MKILYLIHQFYPDFYTGTENFALGLAKATQQRGNRVKVITYSFRERAEYDQQMGEIVYYETLYQSIPVLYLQQLSAPAEIHPSLSNDQMRDFARFVLQKEKPDLLHVAHPMRVPEFIAAAKEMKIPYMLTLTDFFFLCPKSNLMTSSDTLCLGPEGGETCKAQCSELDTQMIASRLAKTTEILNDAQAIIAPSRFLAGIFSREYPALPYQIIGYGINHRSLTKNFKTYRKNDELTFFYGGSLLYHKGVHILLQAFRNLKGRAKLKVYGSGTMDRYLRKLAGDDDRIEFCGVFARDELNRILAQVDVVIVPSIWYENTPIMLLEAQTANVPAIVSDLGGMTETVRDGVHGRAFPVCDHDRLQAILEELIASPELLNDYRQNLKKVHIPSVEQIALAYDRVYQRILQSSDANMKSGSQAR